MSERMDCGYPLAWTDCDPGEGADGMWTCLDCGDGMYAAAPTRAADLARADGQ